MLKLIIRRLPRARPTVGRTHRGMPMRAGKPVPRELYQSDQELLVREGMSCGCLREQKSRKKEVAPDKGCLCALRLYAAGSS